MAVSFSFSCGVLVATTCLMIWPSHGAKHVVRDAPVQLPPFEIAPGVMMPAVNVGHPDGSNCTHGVGPGCQAADLNMTEIWLRVGGRGIDTAFEYDNQAQVGQAVKEAIANGVANRSSIFVTSKIAPAMETGGCTQAGALADVKRDLTLLGLAQLDLVLLHFPCATTEGTKAVWAGLAQAKQLGLARAIGVSHFSKTDLQDIMSLNLGVPAVNQCEMCLGTHDDVTIAFCQANNITYESFGALRNVNLKDPRILTVATAHNVSSAQVALRYVTQRGCPVAVSPGVNEEYIREDLGLGSFTMTSQEMTALSAI
eukprot:m.87801 g.87801  ORF g.87801 m.87801 type:complete len:312 (-) comp26120_c0_seq1:101-1036(-)